MPFSDPIMPVADKQIATPTILLFLRKQLVDRVDCNRDRWPEVQSRMIMSFTNT